MRPRILTVIIFLSSLKSFPQVSLQSGAAQYGIPLYSYVDPANRIGTSVSISYTSGNGLNVSEIPSAVGTGWSLDFGGSITRIQNGEPDDQKNSDTYVYPQDITTNQQALDFYNWLDDYYPNGYLYSEYSPTESITNPGAYTPYSINPAFVYKPHQKYLADREQDVFSFSFNGKTGYFVIGKKDQNGISEVRTLIDSKLKILIVYGDLNNNQNIRTTISEFQIIDDDGIKYVFKDAELSQVVKYNKGHNFSGYGVNLNSYHDIPGYGILDWTPIYMPPTPTSAFAAIKGEAQNSFVKNKWFLSEIINPLTGVKILFEYENYNVDFDGNKIVQKVYSDNKWTFSMTIERIAGVLKRLKKITLSPKEIVEFSYSSANRLDIQTDKMLDNILIKYDGVTKTKWELEHGYFVKTSILPLSHSYSSEELAWARLCLLKLKKYGSGSTGEPPLAFAYYLGTEDGLNSAVPPLFTFQRDLWGYYNPNNSGIGFYNPSTQSNSTSFPPFEPYGGNVLPKFMYEYALDFFWWENRRPSIEARNGILKTITNPLGGTLSFDYELNYHIPGQSIRGHGGVRVSKTTEYDGLDHSRDIITEYKYIKEDGSSSAWGYENNMGIQITESFRTYKKCGDKKFAGLTVGEWAENIANHINYSGWYNNMKNPIERDQTDSPLKNSVTRIGGQILTSIIIAAIVEALAPDYTDNTSLVYSSSTNNMVNTLPYQYSRVEVVQKVLSDNIGKTVYEFTSPNESNTLFQIDFPTLASPYSAKQRCASWLYGQEKKVIVYDKFNNLVSKVENEFTPIKYFYTDPKFASQKWVPNKKTYACPFSSSSVLTDNIDSDIYYPICGRIELASSKHTIFNSTNNSTFTLKEYEYSPNNYLPKKIKSTNSQGELIETYAYYPQDYTLGGGIQTLKDNNILTTPISTQNFITKPGNQKYLTAGSVSEFTNLSNGDVKVTKVYTFRNDNPVISTSVPFSSNQLIPNATYYKETGTINYDAAGIAVQFNSDNEKVSTINDYQNKFEVAKITNADLSEVAYTSFEADGKGRWNFDGANITSEYSPTGKKCYHFEKSVISEISTTIPNSKTYTLSFWAKGGYHHVYKDAAPPTLSYSKSLTISQTGWTYYEYTFTGPGIIYIANIAGHSIPQDFYIDELRLYPASARMSTVTYDPLIGKTSEADANSRIIYYEYDNMGRLRIMRDQYLNVLKTYEYQYKQ